MTNERKNALAKEIESRESQQRVLNQCVITLKRSHELLSKNTTQCLSTNEVENIKQALTELESCEKTLKAVQSEQSSNENEFSSPKKNQQEITTVVSKCQAIKMSLSNKLENVETILKQQNEFSIEIENILQWIASTETSLAVDFYSLTEEQRQTAVLDQERLAEEFSAKKKNIEKLLRTGNELGSVQLEECRSNIVGKVAELSKRWKELGQVFSSQEEHVEECLREHQIYYDAVEQLWDWMQEIGKRMNIQMEKSETNYDEELAEYLCMLKEIKDKSLLFEKVLNAGEKLSARLTEEEGSEILEQLERFKAEWEILKSQVVERLKELNEIIDKDAWLEIVETDGETLDELKSLGVLGKDTESDLTYLANDKALSAENLAEKMELSGHENEFDVNEEDIPGLSTASSYEGTGDFVQILVLPTGNHEATSDSKAETSNVNEGYPDRSPHVTADNNIIQSSATQLNVEDVEKACYHGVVDFEPLKECEVDPESCVQISTQTDINKNTVDSCQHLTAQNIAGTECHKEVFDKEYPDKNTAVISTVQTAQTDISESTNETTDNNLNVENTEDTESLEPVDHEALQTKYESVPVKLFMNHIKDYEEFLDFVESRIPQLNNSESSDTAIQELLIQFNERDKEFENVLETGMSLVLDIPEDEQFRVEEKIIIVEEKWRRLKLDLGKRKAATETALMLENKLEEFQQFVEDVSVFVSGKEIDQEWLFTDEEAASNIECYLARLEREQVALKGLIQGTKDILTNAPPEASEKIKERSCRICRNQTELAGQLVATKKLIERWFEFSSILGNIEAEVKALSEEFKGLVDEEEPCFIMESHLSESRVHMLKILLGSLEGKAEKLSVLSTEYKDVLSSNSDSLKTFKMHERNISEKIALVTDRLEKLENYLAGFKQLEDETNELELEVQQADEALSKLNQDLSRIDEVDSSSKRKQLSEIKHLEERMIDLEPRVQLVKEKSTERLDELNYENSGYWFQENMQCLVSHYEKTKTRVQENRQSIETRVSLKDKFEVKFLEVTSFIEKVEEYLNEDEQIPGDFDITAKEVALLNGRRFLEEMESKVCDVNELLEMCDKLSSIERNDCHKEKTLELKERFGIRLKELNKNVSCLEQILECFNDFEQKVEELSSLMFEAQGFIYGEGVETKGLQDLLELGRSCLENVEHKEETLHELKNRVEQLTEGFSDEDKEVIIAQLEDLENKLSSLKRKVVERITSLEALESRHDSFKNELKEVRSRISSLEQEIKRNDCDKKAKEETLLRLEGKEQPDKSLSPQIPEENMLDKQPEHNFSQKLEELRARLQNLNQMKTELEDESEESKVHLSSMLGLEPLELTFLDLERINKEKMQQLRKYEEKQQHILSKVSEYEEKLQQLKSNLKESKDHPAVVSETAEKTVDLLQEVEDTLVDVCSIESFTNERRRMVNRLEAIRCDCVEMKKCLVGVDQGAKPFTGENNNATLLSDNNYPDFSQARPEIALSEVSNMNVEEEKMNENTQNFLSNDDTQISISQNNSKDFEVLQRQVKALANDEEILNIIISNSEFTCGNLSEELETAKAKLELVKQKEKQLQIINSESVTMWDSVPAKEQETYHENLLEIKEKLVTAKECLVTKIGMLEQCEQTKKLLDENMLECNEILQKLESGENYDKEMGKEYLEVLQDPNNCLEIANRLCFALSVVGDFEEAEEVKDEIQELRERWDTALENLEHELNEVIVVKSLSVDSSEKRISEEHGGIALEDCMLRNKTLSVEQEDDLNMTEGPITADVIEDKAGSINNTSGVPKNVGKEINVMNEGPQTLLPFTRKTKSLNEQEYPVEIIPMEDEHNENDIILTENIAHSLKESLLDGLVVKETPEEVAARNEVPSVVNCEKQVDGNVKEEKISDVRDNEDSIIGITDEPRSETCYPREVAIKSILVDDEDNSCREQEMDGFKSISIETITDTLKVGKSGQYIDKELPGEEMVKFTTVNERQENVLEKNIEEEVNSKVGDNENALEIMSGKIPVKKFEKSRLPKEEIGDVLEENSMKENIAVGPQDVITSVPENFTSDEVINKNGTAVEKQADVTVERVKNDGALDSEWNKTILIDNISRVLQKGGSEACYGDEVPLAGVQDETKFCEEQEVKINKDSFGDTLSERDVFSNGNIADIPDEATVGECIVKEVQEDVITKNRKLLSELQDKDGNEDMVEEMTSDENKDSPRGFINEVDQEGRIVQGISENTNLSETLSEERGADILEEDDVLVAVTADEKDITQKENIDVASHTMNVQNGSDIPCNEAPRIETAVEERSQNNITVIAKAKVDEQLEIAKKEDSLVDEKVLFTLEEKNSNEFDRKEVCKNKTIMDDQTLSEKPGEDFTKKESLASFHEKDMLKENIKGIPQEMSTETSIEIKSPGKDICVLENDEVQRRGHLEGTNLGTDKDLDLFDDQVNVVISDDISKDAIQDETPSQVSLFGEKEITFDEIPPKKTAQHRINQFHIPRSGIVREKNVEDEVRLNANKEIMENEGKIQDSNISIQAGKPLGKTDLIDQQTGVDLSLNCSIMPSFSVARKDDTCNESEAIPLDDAYYTISKVSNELAVIKNMDSTQSISPQNLLEYELRSLHELRNVEIELQSVLSEDINLDSVEKDKKTLLSNLVKEQQLEIERVRDALNSRVRKIQTFFEMKAKMKDRIDKFDVILDEALKVEESNPESSKELIKVEDRVQKMEELLNTHEDLSEEFVSCLEMLSNEYPSLDLTYAKKIDECYNIKKSEVAVLLDVTKNQLNKKLDFEEEINSCSEWLLANEEKIKEVSVSKDTNVGSLERSTKKLDEFLIILDNKIQCFCSHSVPEEKVLSILPEQERNTLLSKAKALENKLIKTREFVVKKIQDTEVKINVTKRSEKINACQLWCKKTSELLNCALNQSSQSILNELSELVNEGEALIENMNSQELFVSDSESFEVLDQAKEMLKMAEKKFQEISSKEETLEKLSSEISDLEIRFLVLFDQNEDIENAEILKSETEIQNAQNQLQDIAKKMKSTFPNLETCPANSRQNELLRRSEYLLEETNKFTEKHVLLENLAHCERVLEEVKDVCSKPTICCLDVVKLKKELEKLGKISVELKDKEAKLQKVGKLI